MGRNRRSSGRPSVVPMRCGRRLSITTAPVRASTITTSNWLSTAAVWRKLSMVISKCTIACLLPSAILLVNSGSCGQGQLEAGEVAGACPVQRVAVPPVVQADQVERDGRVHVLQVHLLQSTVTGVSHVGDGDGLVDGAFDPGAQRVLCLPVLGFLLGAGVVKGLLDLAGPEGELASAAAGGGALVADRAGLAERGGELHHDRLGAALGAGAPGGAGMALRAAHLLGVPVDVERGAVKASTGAGLR